MKPAAPPEPHGAAPCGAATRSGAPCAKQAGWGTDHVGQGKCRLHGGATPVKHGRYSAIKRPRLRQLIAAQDREGDADVLNTLPEIRAVRALFIDYVERYDAYTDALLAWYADWQLGKVIDPDKADALRRVLDAYEAEGDHGDRLSDDAAEDLKQAREIVAVLARPVAGKPHQVLDVADAYKMLGEVTKMVERVERARQATAVSLQELERLFFAMAQVVAAHVTDPAVRDRITAEWRGLRV